MKFALLVLVILPFAIGAPEDEKRASFLSNLLGTDAVATVKQMIAQMGTDEVENQCEQTACPSFMENTLHIHSSLIENVGCSSLCTLAQHIIKNGL